MKTRTLYLSAGISYLVIFFSAIFANFFVLEKVAETPLQIVQESPDLIRWGIMAFMIAALFDIVVAWALKELYKKHPLTSLSTYFRLMHAIMFGLSVFVLLEILSVSSAAEATKLLATFNNIWLIGLFFFGLHLILLPFIIKLPKFIAFMLPLAGTMYMIDTGAHFLMSNYHQYASLFLGIVATTSILGEMGFTLWLLLQKKK